MGAGSSETCSPCPEGEWSPAGSGSAVFCHVHNTAQQSNGSDTSGVPLGLVLGVVGATMVIAIITVLFCKKNLAQGLPTSRGYVLAQVAEPISEHEDQIPLTVGEIELGSQSQPSSDRTSEMKLGGVPYTKFNGCLETNSIDVLPYPSYLCPMETQDAKWHAITGAQDLLTGSHFMAVLYGSSKDIDCALGTGGFGYKVQSFADVGAAVDQARKWLGERGTAAVAEYFSDSPLAEFVA